MFRMLSRALAFLCLAAAASFGAVQSIQLTDSSDVLNGDRQGTAGPYERITAKVHFRVDPKLPENRIVTDIELAPRDAAGMVEFSADLYILRPRDPALGNGTALVEISNRGGKGLLGMFDFAAGSTDPRDPTQFGDGFLLKQGFTLVWIGWEFDVPSSPNLMKLYAPVATEHGKTITGLVSAEWEGDDRVTMISLGDRSQIGYAVADPDAPGTQLTVRDRVAGERRTIPRSDWTFSDERHVTLKAGFQPGKIYEVIYQAKDPVVAGLGFAAVRDLASFLKYGGETTALSDEQKYIHRTLAFGVSQSGRWLREFVYDGFNRDEKGRKAFDGIWAHVGGAGRGSFNVRFAQPSRDGHPFLNVLYPTDLPPFSDEDGFLANTEKEKVVPKIFYSNGSYEYYGRAASLIHTTRDGKSDLPPAPNSRIYFFAGSQHGNGSIPPRKLEAQNLADTNDYRPAMRALLVAMQEWLKDDKAPPPSQFPQVAKDQLVSLGAVAFPHIEGLRIPQHKREAYRLDFSTQPPKLGDPYPTLVPQVDVDGNETSGVRMPEVAVPLASYTGWNLRTAAIGSPDELYSMVGSWIPFPRTAADRERAKDPRRSIEERYSNKREYLEKITAAAQQLQRAGFLVDGDIERVRERAALEWDYALRSN
jgi:hypothetical protein